MNDGGPAFPRAASTDQHDRPCNVYQDQQGMSLRDWLAGMAMQGILASNAEHNAVDFHPGSLVAKAAYGQADAMLVEREKEKPDGP